MKTKRVNKTEDEIAKDMQMKAQVKQDREFAKDIFKIIHGQDTIYDAQTVASAISGYIKYELSVREAGFKVSDLIIDLKNQKDGKIKEGMEALLAMVQDKNAKHTAAFLEKFGQVLGQYSMVTHMKTPMKDIDIKDIIA